MSRLDDFQERHWIIAPWIIGPAILIIAGAVGSVAAAAVYGIGLLL